MAYDALLTVGSTQFDPLVAAFLSAPTLDALAARGFSTVLAQVGKSNLSAPACYFSTEGRHKYKGLDVTVQRFLSDLEPKVGEAKLVVSHAGAGSILSFLRPEVVTATAVSGRTLVLVPNSALMDSHQLDLADELAAKRWATVCSPETLAETLARLNSATGETLVPSSTCPPFDPRRVQAILDSTLGFTSP